MLVKSKQNVFINATKFKLAVLYLLNSYLQMEPEYTHATV